MQESPTRHARPQAAGFRLRNVLIRGYRLAVLLLAAWTLHVAQQRWPATGDLPGINLADVQRLFPTAVRLSPRDAERGTAVVYDARGETIGQVLRTSPETDDLIGYTGPNDLLIGLSTSGAVSRVQLLTSGDTMAHVRAVQESPTFWRQFDGWLPAQQPFPAIAAVSGSTLTSLTMAEAVQRRLAGSSRSLRFPQPVTLDEATASFPVAATLQSDTPRPGWITVQDAQGQRLGYLLRTSPISDGLLGYAGPTESLLAIAADQQTILSARMRSSYDTAEYVERVQDDDDFWRLLTSFPVDAWPRLDFREAGIEGVSGATQTSYAVAEGIRRRLAADVDAATGSHASWGPRRVVREVGLAAFLVGAIALTFLRLPQHRRWRRPWQLLVMLGFGLGLGDLLSIALLAGWSRQGLATTAGISLLALVAVSLLIPWTTRQQIYCHQLCPHGAAQEWLGRFKRLHVHLPQSVSRWLGYLPGLLLLLAFGLAIAVPSFDLSWLEPFDGWSLRAAAVVSGSLAVGSLIMAVCVPQSYCRFGCPTGALLKFIRSHAGKERFGWGEGSAAAALLLAGGWLWATAPGSTFVTAWRETTPAPARPQWHGQAFGTSWSVTFRERIPAIEGLYDSLATELERIESELSHWRSTSAAAQFNASATTLELEFPQEFVDLVARAQAVSDRTDGAYDITVGPLVDAWGFGPSGSKSTPPDEADIARLLEQVGHGKLLVTPEFASLQKTVPGLQIDLGSFLQGYAADRVAELLQAAGITECLVDVGGELRALGRWTVAIEAAHASAPAATLTIENAALATSGIYRPTADGESATRHIISARTGRPVVAPQRQCSVIAPTALEADLWATALFLLPTDAAVTQAAALGYSLRLVDDQGRVTATGQFAP